jgi:hypothetical protein
MPTTTLNVMLPQFARFIGAYIGSFSTTTTISTDTSVISTGLRDAGFTDNDSLNDAFIRINGTNNSDVRRMVSDYTGSTGAIAVTGTSLSAESGSVTFELYRYDVDQLVDALNDAREEAFPTLYQEIFDRKITLRGEQRDYARPTSIQPGFVTSIWQEPRVTAKGFGDNMAGTLDCDLEESGTDDWSVSNGALTKEAETSSPDNFMVFDGQRSGKLIPSASAVCTAYLTDPNPTNYDGEEINVSLWAYSKTASRLSAAIKVDSGSATTGTAHSGGGWERLTTSATIGDPSSSISYGPYITSGTAFVCYFDEVIAVAGPSEPPRTTSELVGTWEERGDNLYVRGCGSDRNLLVIGQGLLSSVSSGTDTVEVAGQQLSRLYTYAAAGFLQGDIDQIDESALNAAQRRWRHYYARALDGYGAMAPPAQYRVAV